MTPKAVRLRTNPAPTCTRTFLVSGACRELLMCSRIRAFGCLCGSKHEKALTTYRISASVRPDLTVELECAEDMIDYTVKYLASPFPERSCVRVPPSRRPGLPLEIMTPSRHSCGVPGTAWIEQPTSYAISCPRNRRSGASGRSRAIDCYGGCRRIQALAIRLCVEPIAAE